MYKLINNAASTVAIRWLQSGRYDDDYGLRFKGSEKRKLRIHDRHLSIPRENSWIKEKMP